MKKFTAIIIGVFLLFNVLAPGFVSYAEETNSSVETSNAGPKVTVNVTNWDGTSIQSGDISKDTVFKAVYTFEEMEINTDEDNSLHKGQVYSLPAIQGIGQFNLTEVKQVSLKIKNTDTELGLITVSPDGDKADLSFEITTDMQGTITDGVFDIELKLNPNDYSATRDISFPDGCTYKFNIAEYMSVQPSIKLTGEKLDDNTASWKAVINKGSITEFDINTKVVIKLSSNEEYVDGSVNINGDKIDAVYDSENHQIICDMAGYLNNTAGDVVINYQTKAVYSITEKDIASNSTKMQIVVRDEAVLEDAAIIDSANAAVTFSKDYNKWLSKEAVGDLSKDGIQQWRIEIDSNDYDFKNVILYDLLSESSEMELVKDSIYENNKQIKKYKSEKGKYTFAINLGNLPKEKKVIEYKTKIVDYANYLKRNHDKKPSNKAWFTYDYDFGEGISNHTGPQAVAIAEVNLKAGVEKKGVSYDTTNHTILWQIAVNQEYQHLSNVSLKDIIPSNQVYVDGSVSEVTCFDAAGSTTTKASKVDYDNTNNCVSVNLGSLEGVKAVFTLQTKLNDESVKIWSDNAENNIVNTIEMTSNEIPELQKDSASISYKSEVISTAISNYNYNEHTADVSITIDKNQMPMENIVVINQMKYDNYEFKVVSDVCVDGVKKDYTVDKSGNLVINLADINEPGEGAIKKITFKVEISSDAYKSLNNKSFKVINVASLQTEDIKKMAEGCVITKSNELSVYNSILTKNGNGDAEKGTASYSIVVNRAKINNTKGFAIKDTLGSSLELDSTSIKVYVCSILDETGKIVEQTLLAPNKYKTRIYNEEGKDIIEVKLPAGDDTYKVTYDANIVDSKLTDCNNTVQITSEGYDSILGQQFDVKSFFEAGANFKARKPKPNAKNEVEKADNTEESTASGQADSLSGLVIKEKRIEALSSGDTNNTDDNHSSFAKTGGFIGTIAAYGAGILLIAVGIYLVLAKKKANEK